MSADTWQNTFGKYAASHFRQGNFIDAGFVAAILFERYIANELEHNSITPSESGDFLYNSINQLSQRDSNKYDKDLLHQLRIIRNKSVIHSDDVLERYTDHSSNYKIKNDIKRLVYFVWQKFAPDHYLRYRDIQNIPLLRADYDILAVREYFQDENPEVDGPSEIIEKRDFHDLINMRKHFLHLAQYIKKKILFKYDSLELDIISKVDSTSGYVWMAIGKKHDHLDHLRDRVRQASVSILATPLDMRIYIDFGGEAYKQRLCWYDFIQSDTFKNLITKDIDLKLFNVDWYCFITKKTPVTEYISTNMLADDISEASSLVKTYEKSHKIISWDKLLVGYILDKDDISYIDICYKLVNIMDIYFSFTNRYCS